jgi:dCMP deaminase
MTRVSQNWDRKYLALALHVASWSKDPSTKVGSVIVGPTNEVRSLGFNGFPRGVNDDVPERWLRPEKYFWCEHGERNAVYNAARMGVSTMASTLYVTSYPAKFGPCDDCARAIIQSGIARLVTEPPAGDLERWAVSFKRGSDMLKEAGVEIDHVQCPSGSEPPRSS